jgi:hypothetical protein
MHRMSGDFYIYLCSTIAGLAAVVQAYFAYRQHRRNMIADASQKQIADSVTASAPGKKSTRTAKVDGVVISSARLAVIAVLLLVTTGLSIAGLVSSVQRKEELNLALRPENIQTTMRQWLDSFGYGSTITSDPASEFNILVNMPLSGKHITIAREKAFNRYIAIGCSVTLSTEDQAALAKLPTNEQTRFALDVKIELDRIGADASLVAPPQIAFWKRLPITNALTEDVLIRTINVMESSEDLIMMTMAKDLTR